MCLSGEKVIYLNKYLWNLAHLKPQYVCDIWVGEPFFLSKQHHLVAEIGKIDASCSTNVLLLMKKNALLLFTGFVEKLSYTKTCWVLKDVTPGWAERQLGSTALCFMQGTRWWECTQEDYLQQGARTRSAWVSEMLRNQRPNCVGIILH